MAADLTAFIYSVAPWYAAWYALYFACGVLSNRLFVTYPKLSPADKAYWRASMVSTVSRRFINLHVVAGVKWLTRHHLDQVHAFYIVQLAWVASKKLRIWAVDDFFAVSEESNSEWRE